MSAQPGSNVPVGAAQQRSPYKPFLFPKGDGIDVQFYSTQVTLTAAQTLPTSILIDSGNDFYWYASMYEADVAGVSFDATTNQLVYPLVSVIITDGSSQRNLMNVAVPITSLAGSGQLPHRGLMPRLFPGNTIISFQWTSFEATRADTIRFTMEGFRMPAGSPWPNFSG